MAKKSSKKKKYYKKTKSAVVADEKKNVSKKKTTPEVKNTNNPNNKTNKNNNGNVRKAVVVATSSKKTVPKKNNFKDVGNKASVSPKKTTLKKKQVKIVTPEIVEPKLEDFVPIPLPDSPEETIFTEPVVEDFESKINSIIEFEVDEKKELSLDDIDVIKFPSKKEKTTIKKKEKTVKSKKTKSEDISSSIDRIEKIDENKIVEEFESDLLPDKKQEENSIFKRKKKGKSYVINIHKTKTYKELEDNLRQLYNRVNDVVQDFDSTVEVEPIEKDFIDDEIVEKPNFLDKINQKVLNVFLIILFIIFFLMCIAFAAFVIYVSTV